jgi:hypothetical protein
MMRFSQNRLFILALAVLFVFTAVFAGAFVFLHLDHTHDHSEGDCPVCVQIKTVQNLFKCLVPAAAFFLLTEWRAGVLKGPQYSSRFLPDPVLLKVRFNT